VVGIRTVMVTVPAMLGDLIERLAIERAHLEIVGQLDRRTGIVRRLKTLRPALVVIGFEDGSAETTIRSLLRQLPDTKFIALRPDGRIVGYELRLHRNKLSERSPAALIEFIRTTQNPDRRGES
jgi:hypothetical protein